jgi:enoyl-CoA hydratase
VDCMPLQQGLQQERRLFLSCFGTQDQREGMEAFVEKRAPAFSHS